MTLTSRPVLFSVSAKTRATIRREEEGQRYTVCPRTGKWGYPNVRHALNWVRRAWRRDRCYLQPYECPSCGQWHLTSHPRPHLHLDYDALPPHELVKIFTASAALPKGPADNGHAQNAPL